MKVLLLLMLHTTPADHRHWHHHHRRHLHAPVLIECAIRTPDGVVFGACPTAPRGTR